MNNTAKILQIGSNGAVVQLPERQFPGVVIQGDSLSILMRKMIEIRLMITDKADISETTSEIDDVIDKLYGRIALYEMTLEKNSIPLPYTKWNKDDFKSNNTKKDKVDAWYDGSAICVIAVGSHGDPLDLGEEEAIEFVNKINHCIKSAQQGDAPEPALPAR